MGITDATNVLRNRNWEPILDIDADVSIEPVLFMSVDGRVHDRHLDIECSFSLLHSLRIYARTIEWAHKNGVVVVCEIIPDLLGLGRELSLFCS